MCLDPYLGYTERYFCVALESRRTDVLFVGLVQWSEGVTSVVMCI